MFRKIEKPKAGQTFICYGCKNAEKSQKNFFEEDSMIDLLREKSGLVDQNNSVRAKTDMNTGMIDIEFHYRYANNKAEFVEAMTKFLKSAVSENVEWTYAEKETQQFMGMDPVFTINRSHLSELIHGLIQKETQPLNTAILSGNLKAEAAVCFGFHG